mmetsp:Transcript_11965/g.37239  ORF Transcript_11965/g.37239 Transcript_11965/m.37239 type:complete len:509 (-) Transcript_11965:21-1547(-)
MYGATTLHEHQVTPPGHRVDNAVRHATSVTVKRAVGLLDVELLEERLGGDRLGALDRAALQAVPDDARQHADLARHAEEHGVVVLLRDAVVLQEDARVRVDVGVRVGRLAVLGEDARHDLVDGVDQLEELVVGEVARGELALARVARVGLAEHGVAVARHDALRVQQVPRELGEALLELLLVVDVDAGVLALLLHLEQVREHLLVGQAVQRARETVHARGVREVRVGQRRGDERRGVRRDVAALVVDVDGQVQAHALHDLLVGEAHLVGEVTRPVEVGVERRDVGRLARRAAVHHGGDLRRAGDAVERVLDRQLPVVVLVGLALGVRRGELGVVLEGHETDDVLGHRVHVGRDGVEGLAGRGDRLGVGALLELGVEGLGLRLGRHVAGEQEPEHRLRQRLGAARGLGQGLLALRDGEAAEADALVGVEQRRLVHEAGDAAHALVRLLDGGVGQGDVAVLLEELGHLGGLLGLLVQQRLLELAGDVRRGEAGAGERLVRGAGEAHDLTQ